MLRTYLAGRWLLLCGMLVLITGCASTSARPLSTYSGPTLTKPTRVVVTDFVGSADQISLNRGPRAVLGLQSDGRSVSADQLKLAQEVATVLSEELVKRITALGLAAERVPKGEKAEPGMMVIEGRFVSIDEGSRVKRMVIGFGAGGSVVKTVADVYVGSADGPVLAQTFETEAKSPPIPGLVAGGPALAAGRVVVAGAVGAAKVASEPRTEVAADAKRTAAQLGKRLGEFFVTQGWIPQDALK